MLSSKPKMKNSSLTDEDTLALDETEYHTDLTKDYETVTISMKKVFTFETKLISKKAPIRTDTLKDNQAILGQHGQLRIPDKILEKIKWKPFSKIWFEIDDEEMETIIMGTIPETQEEFLKKVLALGKE